jgi:hypothetical protein
MAIKEALTEAQLQAQILEVTHKLKDYQIPLEQWGTGKAKTVRHLAKEILEGETVLVDKDGEVIRRVELVHVDVRHTTDNGEIQLVEDRQVFTDGRERRRGLTGISEKMKPGEDPLASAKRALAEEIGVTGNGEIIKLGVEEETQTSPSYPGLTTEYLRHEMLTQLPESAFNSDGYVEVQADKSTYFVWQVIQYSNHF